MTIHLRDIPAFHFLTFRCFDIFWRQRFFNCLQKTNLKTLFFLDAHNIRPQENSATWLSASSLIKKHLYQVCLIRYSCSYQLYTFIILSWGDDPSASVNCNTNFLFYEPGRNMVKQSCLDYWDFLRAQQSKNRIIRVIIAAIRYIIASIFNKWNKFPSMWPSSKKYTFPNLVRIEKKFWKLRKFSKTSADLLVY